MIPFYAGLATIIAIITTLVTVFAKIKKAGRDEIKVEEGERNAKNVEIIADINSAGNRSRGSKLRDDDGFKRS